MVSLRWNADWETGHRKIDRQHRQLFFQYELLKTAMLDKDAAARIPGLLTHIAAHLDEHFREEEREMAATNYPGAEAHRILHDLMRREVAGVRHGIDNNPSLLTVEVLDSLLERFVGHIGVEDYSLVRHLDLRRSAEVPRPRGESQVGYAGAGLPWNPRTPS
jgi:hemerythrin-like metal-binding protein